jgi:hypothetical protein
LQDSDVEEDNIPFSELMEKRKADKQQTIVLITETEDQVSEPVVIDEVPSVTVTKTTVTEATMTETVVQLVKVAKHFEAGLFIGEITAVSINRGRNLYTVLYEDSDGEDMNDREYKEARALYEQTQGVSGNTNETEKETEETKDEQLHSGGETEGSEFAPSDDEAHKIRRKTKRQKPKSPAKEKEKTKRRKTSKDVETKGRKQKNPGIDVEAILLTGSKDNITNKTVALMTEAEQASLKTTTAGKQDNSSAS